MAQNVVIVESPAKAKTIQRYLGKNYAVTSSFGHIRDLPTKRMAVDIEHDFEPEYEIPNDKKKRVSELKTAVKTAKTVWLATDEDREGEAIAWHLAEALKLKPAQIKRIVFHEITEGAIKAAIEKPRGIDRPLVDAQQARRVLDRLVGYEISPVLWRKVRPGLSAGRVQSVAVRLIVERERAIASHKPKLSFKLTARLEHRGQPFDATLDDQPDAKRAEQVLRDLQASAVSVAEVTQSEGQRNPAPPFTTSTLQQEASRRLGYSVKQTMSLAQKLYESGAITYMRTDSLSIAKPAQAAAASYIEKTYGADHVQVRSYKTKSRSAQEAHEAIRPTNPQTVSAGGDAKAKKLYELIRGRFLASQMAPARLARTTITMDGGGHTLTAKGEVIRFAGWLAAYPQSSLKDNELPPLSKGDQPELIEARAVETASRPPARFTEASLVKQLEEMGIGRPSTYAPTISTIQDRGYVHREPTPEQEQSFTLIELKDGQIKSSVQTKTTGGEQRKLQPTDTGVVVTDFLVKHFPNVVDYDFTAEVEDEFDAIAAGKTSWNAMIKRFYREFEPTVKAAQAVSKQEASQARELGTDPNSGKPVLARYGRFGPMIQIGTADDEDKPRFAPMPQGATLDSVTLEQALKMFKLPRLLGQDGAGKDILANIGRYGPYVQRERTFASIPKDWDVFTIELPEALKLIEDSERKKQQSIIATFGDISIKRGRFGPYVTNGKVNVKIPKDTDPESLDESAALALLKKKA